MASSAPEPKVMVPMQILETEIALLPSRLNCMPARLFQIQGRLGNSQDKPRAQRGALGSQGGPATRCSVACVIPVVSARPTAAGTGTQGWNAPFNRALNDPLNVAHGSRVSIALRSTSTRDDEACV